MCKRMSDKKLIAKMEITPFVFIKRIIFIFMCISFIICFSTCVTHYGSFKMWQCIMEECLFIFLSIAILAIFYGKCKDKFVDTCWPSYLSGVYDERCIRSALLSHGMGVDEIKEFPTILEKDGKLYTINICVLHSASTGALIPLRFHHWWLILERI